MIAQVSTHGKHRHSIADVTKDVSIRITVIAFGPSIVRRTGAFKEVITHTFYSIILSVAEMVVVVKIIVIIYSDLNSTVVCIGNRPAHDICR